MRAAHSCRWSCAFARPAQALSDRDFAALPPGPRPSPAITRTAEPHLPGAATRLLLNLTTRPRPVYREHAAHARKVRSHGVQLRLHRHHALHQASQRVHHGRRHRRHALIAECRGQSGGAHAPCVVCHAGRRLWRRRKPTGSDGRVQWRLPLRGVGPEHTQRNAIAESVACVQCRGRVRAHAIVRVGVCTAHLGLW